MSARQYRILGTAGHIDHGKSRLVRALTGIDPDRLPEEKARGMTIELGFAHFDLALPQSSAAGDPADAIRFGVVDVPGHERFIRTMVSGASGVDLGLLVVAADDGVMPQTREHIEILDLLGVRFGVIALNKADLVDRDRLDAVCGQIVAAAGQTPLKNWRIVPVSAATGAGLDELRTALAAVAAALPSRRESSIFRLAIDRVFAMRGRGTIVTGSVLSGTAVAGAALELHPAVIPCRVREIQSYGSATAAVRIGQRAALNLTGIDRDSIQRGHELATPHYLTPARHVDARVTILARREHLVPPFRRVRVEMATWEQVAIMVVLDGAVANSGDSRAVAPGAAALVQFRFKTPVVASFGQRFILRDENAETTLGGGVILRPVSRRVSHRQDREIAALRSIEHADAEHRAAEALRSSGFEPLRDEAVACRAGVEPGDAAAIRERLRQQGMLVSPVPGVEVHRDVVRTLQERAIAFLNRHHRAAPCEPGLLAEQFSGYIDRRSVPGMGSALSAELRNSGEITRSGPFVVHRTFRPAVSREDQDAMERVVAEIDAGDLDPPLWDKLRSLSGLSAVRQARLMEMARSDARLVLIAPRHFMGTAAAARFTSAVRELGAAGRKFTLAEVRDRLKLSRRAVQPFLEHLDRIRITRRVGDERVLV